MIHYKKSLNKNFLKVEKIPYKLIKVWRGFYIYSTKGKPFSKRYAKKTLNQLLKIKL
jgi:hypothetical protein